VSAAFCVLKSDELKVCSERSPPTLTARTCPPVSTNGAKKLVSDIAFVISSLLS